jgi:pyruvate formate lyase activating enzyme
MYECQLYKKLDNKLIECTACAFRCKIQLGNTGNCGVRKNHDGKLILGVYALPISQNIDPIEKKPLYHFLPGTKTYSLGTVGCNFKCGFCQNYEISQTNELEGEDMPPKKIVEEAIKNKCLSISYTYNEPTIWAEYAKEIAEIAKEHGLKNIMVSNGYETKEAIDFLSPTIDAINIDLKAMTNNFYVKNAKAMLQPVLETIKYAKEKGIWIEITTLLIPGENDSEKELEEIAKFIASIDKNIPWHISRFFPMFKMLKKDPTEMKTLYKAEKIGKKYLNYVYVGNIHETQSTFCPNCQKELIKRNNKINLQLKNNTCPNCNKKIEGIWEL